MIWNAHKFTSTPAQPPALTRATNTVFAADRTVLSEQAWLSKWFDFGSASTRNDGGEKSAEVTDKLLASYW